MPKVLFTPEAMLHVEGRHTEILKQAGLEVAYPRNPEFARGLCHEQECLDELRDAEAVVAGSEHLTASLLEKLPRLRVIARNGVGYDRVDICEKELEEATVGVEAAGIQDRILLAEEGGYALLQLPVNILSAADETYG